MGGIILSSTMLINKILFSITTIIDDVKKIEKGNLKHRIENRYNTKGINELIITLNEMLERIDSGFEKISQFTSDVSHELKTPLTAIKGLIEVELIKNRSAEEYKEALIKIVEETNWLISIVNDLLFMTKIESDSENKIFEKVDLNEVISEIVDLLSLYAEERGVKLIFKKNSLIYINGDEGKIKRMILNLISNAIKYNKDNGIVEIKCEEDNEEISIVVKDNGIGIKPENLEKVFERFYREDKIRTSKQSGSGLGLSLANLIAIHHGGKINLDSIEGKGTEVSVKFPK